MQKLRWLSVAVALAAAAGVAPAAGHTGHPHDHGLKATLDARETRRAPAQLTTFPVTVGEWSDPISLPLTGIHATVLPTGKVLWFSYPVNEIGSDAWLWDPVTGVAENVSLATVRDIFCVAQSLLADGRLFTTGGHVPGGSYGLGVRETDFFDPVQRTWTGGPGLSIERWYPTNVELGSGEVLVFGGQKDDTTPSETVDAYDPATNSVRRLPDTATKRVNAYPRLHLLLSGEISFTNQKRTELFNPATSTWRYVTNMLFGGRGVSDHSVLLPGLTKVLEFGGKSGTNPATNTAELIDFAEAKPKWRNTAPLNFPRMYGNPVVLPDGTVLMVGGGRGPGLYENPVLEAELFDPQTETWTVMAAQRAPRIYHSTAVLLPDGRVVSAGHDRGAYQFTAEIYSPPYLFRGPRPQITSAPSSIGYATSFSVSTPDAAAVEQVVLRRPDSVTHSVNFDQRQLELPFTVEADGTLTVSSPATGNHAPPGPYMLFLLSSSGVPSVASWVAVGQAGGEAPTISGFAPASGPVGASVAISGTAFTGATGVTFNGAAAAFSIDSDGQITATVPAAATTGRIAVTTPHGTATSPTEFAVEAPRPSISGFAPASGPVGTSVVVSGKGLTGATSVTFNGIGASSFGVDSDTQLTAVVPGGASTGPIGVTTPGGTAASETPFTVTAASYRDVVLSDSPAAYWRLGETTGGAADERGGPAGTYTGGVRRGVPGALLSDGDRAVGLNGTDAYVSVPDNAALDVGDTFTYELWLRRGATQGVTQRILHKGAGTAALGFGPSNKLVFIPGGAGATPLATASAPLTDHVWHHVVVTKAGADVHIYVDHVDVTVPGTNTTLTNNSAALNIGRALSGSAYFDGEVDEVAIYPYALTAQQVLDHFRAR